MIARLLPFIALAWILPAVLEVAKLAFAERNGRPQPLPTYIRSWVLQSTTFTTSIFITEFFRQ